jgi:hypothetical protein
VNDGDDGMIVHDSISVEDYIMLQSAITACTESEDCSAHVDHLLMSVLAMDLLNSTRLGWAAVCAGLAMDAAATVGPDTLPIGSSVHGMYTNLVQDG